MSAPTPWIYDAAREEIWAGDQLIASLCPPHVDALPDHPDRARNGVLIATAPELVEFVQEIAATPCLEALRSHLTGACACDPCRARTLLASLEA